MTASGAVIMTFFATIWWIVGLPAAGQPAVVAFSAPVVVAPLIAHEIVDPAARTRAAIGW